MSKIKPEKGAVGGTLSCPKCNSFHWRIIIWCGGHVDLACNICGGVIDHKDIVVEHALKIHKDGESCPGCESAKKVPT